MIRIFNHYFHKRSLYQASFDIGLVLMVVVIAFFYQSQSPIASNTPVFSGAFFMATGISTINTGLGFYQRIQRLSRPQLGMRAFFALALSSLLAYVIYRYASMPEQDGKALLFALMAATGLMLLHRIYMACTAPERIGHTRVLIYGVGMRERKLGEILKSTDPSIEVVGYFTNTDDHDDSILTRASGSTKMSLTELVQSERIQEIVVAVSERRGGSIPLRELLDCKLHGVKVVDSATYLEKTLGQVHRDSVSAGWLIFGDGFEKGILNSVSKRLFDIVFATLLLLSTFPLICLTSILIYLESGAPVLYRQERVGLYGRSFSLLKFRSMRVDAEKDGTPRWASSGDHRVTRVGRIIRKLRIDELPQLFNVLVGEMSLVGPRPERPFFVNELAKELPYYAVRHSLKPGITGWAQVRYHYGSSVEDAAEKLQYDLYYVKNRTLFLDLVVLFETVGVVLTGKGAQ